VVVETGTAALSVYISATGSPTKVVTNTTAQNPSGTTVYVGTNHSVQNILGPLTISGTGTISNQVTVDDAADQTVHAISLGNDTSLFGKITGLAPVKIDYQYAKTSTFYRLPGTASNAVNIFATGTSTSVFGSTYELTVFLDHSQNQVTVHATGGLTYFSGGDAQFFNMDAGATATVTGLTIANPYGRSISNYGNLTAARSTVTGTIGGFLDADGIINYGFLDLIDSRITNNFSTQNGGGIANMLGGTVQIIDSLVNSNLANGYGGGVYNQGTLQISNSTFTANAAANGGALYVATNSSATVNNSILWGDTAYEVVSAGLAYISYSLAQGAITLVFAPGPPASVVVNTAITPTVTVDTDPPALHD